MRNLGIFSLILSICAIVLSIAFLSTVQTVQKNQDNIISRVETLEQNSGEDPGEDPGETPNANIQFVLLEPGESLQLTADMYCIDVELQRESAGGIYSDPVDGPPGERIDVTEDSYDEDFENSYKFRYYIGTNNYIYNFSARYTAEGAFMIKAEEKFISGNSFPFITLSENNTRPVTVIIYYNKK